MVTLHIDAPDKVREDSVSAALKKHGREWASPPEMRWPLSLDHLVDDLKRAIHGECHASLSAQARSILISKAGGVLEFVTEGRKKTIEYVPNLISKTAEFTHDQVGLCLANFLKIACYYSHEPAYHLANLEGFIVADELKPFMMMASRPQTKYHVLGHLLGAPADKLVDGQVDGIGMKNITERVMAPAKVFDKLARPEEQREDICRWLVPQIHWFATSLPPSYSGAWRLSR